MGVKERRSITLVITRSKGNYPESEEIDEVEEYVVGRRYFFVRSRKPPYNMSYPRGSIIAVQQKRSWREDEDWRPVSLHRAIDKVRRAE